MERIKTMSKHLPVPHNEKLQESLTASKGFAVRCEAKDDETVELMILSHIGADIDDQGTTAASVNKFLKANPKKNVNVRINSPGGLAFDGIAIFNALKDHEGHVTTTVEAIAGSAAAIITFAGDTIKMQENAQLFIHRAWSIAIGNVDDFMDSAEFLSKLDDAMALTISKRSQVDIDAVKDFMKGKVDGTTFSAEEAKDIGFVDEIIPVAEKETDKKEAESLKRKQTFLLADAQAKLKTMEFDNQ